MAARRARHSLPPAALALALSAVLVACLLEPVDAPPGAATTPALEPAVPSPPPAGSADPGGNDDICALMATGELFCWDANDVGEAIVVPGRYIAIEEIGGEICAVTENGDSVCWGSGAPGRDGPP